MRRAVFEASATKTTAPGWTQLLREVADEASQAGEEDEARAQVEATVEELPASAGGARPLPGCIGFQGEDQAVTAVYRGDLAERPEAGGQIRAGLSHHRCCWTATMARLRAWRYRHPCHPGGDVEVLQERGFYTIEKKKLVPTAPGSGLHPGATADRNDPRHDGAVA